MFINCLSNRRQWWTWQSAFGGDVHLWFYSPESLCLYPPQNGHYSYSSFMRTISSSPRFSGGQLSPTNIHFKVGDVLWIMLHAVISQPECPRRRTEQCAAANAKVRQTLTWFHDACTRCLQHSDVCVSPMINMWTHCFPLWVYMSAVNWGTRSPLL